MPLRFDRLLTLALVVLAATALPIFTLAGDEPAAPAKPEAEEPEFAMHVLEGDLPDPVEQIRSALAHRVSLQATEQPLFDFIEDIGKRMQIPVSVDATSLIDEGISDVSPVTINIKGVTLKSALAMILHPLGARAVVRNEALTVLSDRDATKVLERRVYRVGDLVSDPTDPRRFSTVRNLIDLIQKTTGNNLRNPWENVHGEGGSIAALTSTGDTLLVIRQTEEVHVEIEQVLEDMRSALSIQDRKVEPNRPAEPKTTKSDKPRGGEATSEACLYDVMQVCPRDGTSYDLPKFVRMASAVARSPKGDEPAPVIEGLNLQGKPVIFVQGTRRQQTRVAMFVEDMQQAHDYLFPLSKISCSLGIPLSPFYLLGAGE